MPHLLFCFILKCPNWLARQEVALRAHAVVGLYETAYPTVKNCQKVFGDGNTGAQRKATD